jgi:hypothetical protein
MIFYHKNHVFYCIFSIHRQRDSLFYYDYAVKKRTSDLAFTTKIKS